MEATMFPLSQELEAAVAWSIFADLLRRHPGELFLWMDYYPTGDQMLSAARRDKKMWVSLNSRGGGLWVRDADRHFRHETSIWHVAVQNSVRAASRLVEAALGLAEVPQSAPSTGETLVPRVIAGLLARHALTTHPWIVSARHELPELTQDSLGVLVGRNLVLVEPTPVPIVGWQVRQIDGNKEASFNTRGSAVSSEGEIIDLHKAYATHGRKLDPVIDLVFGTL